MIVDGATDVVMTEGEVAKKVDEGAAEETTDAKPEEKALEVKTPSESQYNMHGILIQGSSSPVELLGVAILR